MTQILCVIFWSMLLITINRGFSHDLNMSKDNIVQHNTNIDYTKVFNFWKEHKKEFVLHGEHKEVVLVMGNTGAGKSTLVSALIGRNLKVIKPNGYLVISDEENRIGTGTSSKTLIPDVMIDNERNVTYVDCSGFRDNREVEYEIFSLYFQNILMNQIEKIKLILVINYESLKFNGNKNDFDDLLEHVAQFVKDIAKFHSGIALVATKVENIYEENDDGNMILSNDDQSVLNGIADFLKSKKETYHNKTRNFEQYQIFENFIDVLLQKNNKSYSKIAIFRQPTRQGLLKNIPKMRNEISAIAKMITENLHYVQTQKGDFGFALSTSSKNTIDQIVNNIFRNALTNHIHTIEYQIHGYHKWIEKNISEIRVLRDRVSHNYDYIISEMRNVDKPEKLIERFLNIAETLEPHTARSNLKMSISDDFETLRFFTTVWNSNEDLYMVLLKNKTQNCINSIENLKIFYDFLNNLLHKLDAYNLQQLRNNHSIENIYASIVDSTYRVIQDIPDLENIVKAIGNDEIYPKIKTLELDQVQLKHLKAVFSAFRREIYIECTSISMFVEGYNIKISDVIGKKCWGHVKRVEIFALNKIFIDEIVNKTDDKTQFFIFAPTWEVVGKPKIILDGKAGEPHEDAFAQSGAYKLVVEDYFRQALPTYPIDGLAGTSGDDGGDFYGIGHEFINLEHLEIHSNGGKGGPGQHGGNGADGIAGDALSELIFVQAERMLSAPELNDYLRRYSFQYHMAEEYYFWSIDFFADLEYDTIKHYRFNVSGVPATEPMDGGNGGVGGLGGYPGKIIINGLGKSVEVKTSTNPGSTGLGGQGGHGGKGLFKPRSVEFILSQGALHFYPSIFKVKYRNIKWKDGDEIPAGKDGKPDSNTDGREFKIRTQTHIYPVIESYVKFVKSNLFENIKESEFRDFITKFQNDPEIYSISQAHNNTMNLHPNMFVDRDGLLQSL